MPDENVIGGVKVQIEGDVSPLEKDFQDAIALAVASGRTLAEAIAQATPILEGVGQAAQQAAQQLNLFGAAEQSIPFAETNGQLNLFATELEKITAAESNVLNSVTRTGQAVQQTTPIWDQLRQKFTDLEAAWPDFAQGVQNFISHPLQFAGNAAKEFLLAVGPIGGIALAGAVGLFELGKGALNLVEQFGQAAEQTGNLADRLNLTWVETRRLEEMAQIAGVSVQSLGAASFRLAESLEQGSKQGEKIRQKLQEIGVTGQTSGELLTSFLNKLAQIPDDTKRIALAHEVLGRSSSQIIPLIKNYDQLQRSIRELGPAIGEELAGNLQNADDSLDKLNISWNRFKEQIAAAVAPAVASLVDNLRGLIVEMSRLTIETVENARALAAMIPSDLLAALHTLGNLFSALNPVLNAVKMAFRAIGEELRLFNEIAAEVTGKTFKNIQEAAEKTGAALKDKIHANIVAATTGTKDFAQVWQTSGGGVRALIGDIVAQHEKLTTRVHDSKAAYDQLAEAYRTGTALANGYKVTAGDVAQALSNLKAAEAAATLTKEEHVKQTGHLTKSFHTMAPAIQMLVDEQKIWHAEAERSIETTARYNVAMRGMIEGFRSLTMIELARKHLDDFNKGLDKLIQESPVLDLSPYSPIFQQVAKDIQHITDALNETAKKTLEADSGFKQLEDGLRALGITGAADYEHMVDVAQKAYDDILKSGKYTDNELAQAAAELTLRQARYALATKDMTIDVYRDIVNAVQKDLDDLDGKEHESTNRRGGYERTLGQEIQQINRSTFDSLERGLAKTIVDFKGWSDLWKTLWHKLAEDVLTIMFKVLLDPLEKAIAKVLGGVFGGAASAGGSAAGGAIGTAGSAAGSVGGIAGAGLSGIAGIVTGAISAVTGVIGVFQNMHQETSLNAIEHNTRYSMMYLGERADGGILGVLFRVLDEVSFGVSVKAMEASRDILMDIRSILTSNGGGGHGALATSTGMASAYSVHIDLSGAHLSGDLTDQQVRNVFDRGVRLSKLGGAFPPGRFS